MVDALPDAASANLAVLRLAQEDIEARLCEENVMHCDPLLDVAVGGIRILVRVAQVNGDRATSGGTRPDRPSARALRGA